MPELPDVEVYVACLARRVVGVPLERLSIVNPFVLRSVDPAPSAFERRHVRGVARLGKRIVLEFDGELYCVLHLMIAGRLQWLEREKRAPQKLTLAVFVFPSGQLVFTEAGTKRRASLHCERGRSALLTHARGGLEVLDASFDAFDQALRRENHTLKRALTDPRLFSGIGNAYSDEILHAAKLSPVRLTHALDADAAHRLFVAARATLVSWRDRLREEVGERWPTKVTAFRPDMAVHGRFGKPCPTCSAPVQRIVYAANECNYCARCQTQGKLLADRVLSRLLKDDWPRSLDELEERRQAR